jgi:hypothetical protein
LVDREISSSRWINTSELARVERPPSVVVADRHHGLPTRLLDWTESILVALYFAVQKPLDQAGEIWCIRPDALNHRSNYSLHSGDRPIIKYMAEAAFVNEQPDRLSDLAGKYQIPKLAAINPSAFLPPMEFPRMNAQSSRFTIHPPPDGNNVIEKLLQGPRQIIRYEIPSHYKPSLLKDLITLGVTEETLFCTLDALAATVKADVYEADRGEIYPDPPTFE